MNDPERLGDWFGRFMTLYRSVGDRLIPDPPRSRIEIEWDLQQGAVLERHPWTRAAWRRSKATKSEKAPDAAALYIAGQTHALPVSDARLLAAAEILDCDLYAALSAQAQELVHALIEQGHYRLRVEDGPSESDESA
jgi:50S ribosomal protein L16 3-hydroxylase